jgi:hypothetical protein
VRKPFGQREIRKLLFAAPRRTAVGFVVCLTIVAGAVSGMLLSGLVFGPRHGATGRLYTSPRAALTDVERHDPSLGASPKLPTIEDLQGRPHALPPPGVSILRYFDFEEINSRDVQTIETEAGRYPRVTTYVAFSSANPAQVAQQVLQNGFRSSFLYDRGGELRKALNAFFNGRIYVFDAAGRLVFMDYPSEPDTEVLNKARLAIEYALRGD